MDYNYYCDGSDFFEDIKDFNNQQLENFMKIPNFERKSAFIFDLINPKEDEPKEVKLKLEFFWR